MKRRILIFTDYYLPGHLGGGPIRAIENLVNTLSNEFDFWIITRNHDLGTDCPYSEVISNNWQKVGKANVFYLSKINSSLVFLCRLINSIAHDILYLNSFFSFRFSIIPFVLCRLRLIKSHTIIIAPRGEFSPGALEIKPIKKTIYIQLAKIIRLYRDVIWQASSSCDKKYINLQFNKNRDGKEGIYILIAPDMLAPVQESQNIKIRPIHKKPGSIKIIFLSRISPNKNLDYALNVLNILTGEIEFNIFGPIENMSYWNKCKKIIREMPSNIHVKYKGAIDHHEVDYQMSCHHLLFFPTRGENYGYVIVEAFVAGCPVLISDLTPWRGLEDDGVGWDISLDNPKKIAAILQMCIDMDNCRMMVISRKAREYGVQIMMDREAVKKHRELFNISTSIIHEDI